MKTNSGRSRPKASMQNLLDALDEFEPGFVMERLQPTQADVRDGLALDITLVTNSVREFERVPGLRVENWV